MNVDGGHAYVANCSCPTKYPWLVFIDRPETHRADLDHSLPFDLAAYAVVRRDAMLEAVLAMQQGL